MEKRWEALEAGVICWSTYQGYFLALHLFPNQLDLSLILKPNPLILIKSSSDLYSKVSIIKN